MTVLLARTMHLAGVSWPDEADDYQKYLFGTNGLEQGSFPLIGDMCLGIWQDYRLISNLFFNSIAPPDSALWLARSRTMLSHSRRTLAIFVVLSMLLVSGYASAQSIFNESHHSHHQKATHSTVLCSWMCAAGHAEDVIGPTVLINCGPIATANPSTFNFIHQGILDTEPSRGPPLSSMI